MTYEVAASRGTVDEWRVEAIDDQGEGQVYVAIFTGPSARQRAEEYAEWKNAAAGDRRVQRTMVREDRRQPAHA